MGEMGWSRHSLYTSYVLYSPVRVLEAELRIFR